MCCRIATELWPSKRIRAINRLRDLQDSSGSTAGWKELLSYGRTLGLESECLREAV